MNDPPADASFLPISFQDYVFARARIRFFNVQRLLRLLTKVDFQAIAQ
jgi:hypothetical protein